MMQRLIFTSALMLCCAAALLAQNIGIGTTTPTAKLQVVGDLDVQTVVMDSSEVLDTVPTLHADIGRVGIGTATPAPSSKLEISSDSSGILIPRMTVGTRDAMTSPATGLLVYVTGINVFSYYDGTSWVSLGGTVTQLADADADTRILVEKTSDEDTIIFQVAGTEYFRMVPGRLEDVNTGNSIIIGEGAGGNDDFSDNKNVYIGRQAGRINTNTIGGNTLVGYQAMYFGSAENTTAIGAKTLFNNNGTLNTAAGYNGLNSNTTGSSNTGIGFQALWYNETGNNNTAAGVSALLWHQGSDNTALGKEALYGDISDPSSNTGSGNTALGARSLYNHTTGSDNTAVGDSALFDNTTGSSNTALGYQANVSAADLDSATAIGRAASVNASHKIRLGATSITTIEGQVAYSFPSDARFKDNVKADVPGLDFILKLHPVSYNFDRLAFARHIGENTVGREQVLQHLSERRTVGFLAQEVQELVAASGFVAFDAVHAPTNERDNYSLSYAHFVVPLVKAVQELAGQYDTLETGTDLQDEMFEANQTAITALLQRIAALETTQAKPVQ